MGGIYFNSSFFIKNQQWKYKDGYHIGDWVKFSNESIDGRTIYKNNKPHIKILFCYGKTLIIKDIATGEKGYYSNKT